MIKQLVDKWEEHRAALVDWAVRTQPEYRDMVKEIVTRTSGDEYRSDWYPSPDRIVEIDHGDFQGTLLFIVGAKGYQPSRYWSVFVDYGSCSGCDAREDACDIARYHGDPAKTRAAWERLLLTIVQDFQAVRAPGGES